MTETKHKKKKLTETVKVPMKGDRRVELDRLKILAAEPARTDRPQAVALSDIRQCTAIFQPRSTDGRDGSKSDRHVRTLVSALRNSRTRDLEPVLVMPLGQRWQLIEGHHRVAAYMTVRRATPIPVEIFEGTLNDAIAQSIGRNSKNKLPMSLQERREAAWRLVSLPKVERDGTIVYQFTVNQVVELSGMSPRSVKKMRGIRSFIQDLCKDDGSVQYTNEDIQTLELWQAESLFAGQGLVEQERDYDLEQAVTDYVGRLEKTFGMSWVGQAEAFARALLAASERGAGLVYDHLNNELGAERVEDSEGMPKVSNEELEDMFIEHLAAADSAFIAKLREILWDGPKL